jgi:hypothetical protein
MRKVFITAALPTILIAIGLLAFTVSHPKVKREIKLEQVEAILETHGVTWLTCNKATYGRCMIEQPRPPIAAERAEREALQAAAKLFARNRAEREQERDRANPTATPSPSPKNQTTVLAVR